LQKTDKLVYDHKRIEEYSTPKVRPYYVGPVMEILMKEIVDGYLEAGLYAKGISDVVSPAFLVVKMKDENDAESRELMRLLKKTKRVSNRNFYLTKSKAYLHELAERIKERFDIRLVGDYRAENDNTVPDIYPHTRSTDIFSFMHGHTWKSVFDFKACFNVITTTPAAQRALAIITPHGTYLPLVMPFGPTNAPAVSERFTNMVTEDLENTYKFVDDTITISPSDEVHIFDLYRFFNRVRSHHLRFGFKKAQIAVRELEYLGKVATLEGIRPSDKGLTKLRTYNRPLNTKQVKSFHAFLRWMGEFIFNL